MTTLEIILVAILWAVIGIWVSYKRNWYKEYHDMIDMVELAIMFNIIFAPIILIRAIFFQFILRTWTGNWDD